MSKVAEESDIGNGTGFLQRLGWHAIELRLTNEDLETSIAASAVWFQIHPAQPPYAPVPLALPARLRWSPKTDAGWDFAVRGRALLEGEQTKAAAQVGVDAAAKQMANEYYEPLIVEQMAKM